MTFNIHQLDHLPQCSAAGTIVVPDVFFLKEAESKKKRGSVSLELHKIPRLQKITLVNPAKIDTNREQASGKMEAPRVKKAKVDSEST